MKSPVLAVDIIIEYPDGDIVLIKRGIEPFKGMWALPGGHVEVGETVESAAVREAGEETGLLISLEEIIGVYSDPDRDPRGHTVSIAYRARPVGGKLQASTDAKEAIKTGKFRDMPLAFDHEKIINDAFK